MTRMRRCPQVSTRSSTLTAMTDSHSSTRSFDCEANFTAFAFTFQRFFHCKFQSQVCFAADFIKPPSLDVKSFDFIKRKFIIGTITKLRRSS